MGKATFTFPKGFLWGTATASYQVEGNNFNNNWYEWEKSSHIIDDHICGIACDWWKGNRWREDFDRAANSGQNAHRLSLEWSRIQPEQDRWNEAALDKYREMLLGLRDRGMTPLVTLHHFTDPTWIMDNGGWEDEKTPEYFNAYVEKVVTTLGEFVDIWITINEPNVYAVLGYLFGDFPPGKKDFRSLFTVIENLIKGHALGYKSIHKHQPDAKVGMAINYRGFRPKNPGNPLDRLVALLLSKYYNDIFPKAAKEGILRFPLSRKKLEIAKNSMDFLGLNYYTGDVVSFSLANSQELFTKRTYPIGADISETGFISNDPTGFFNALKWCLQFNIPIIVTENGVEDSEDLMRPRYIAQHIHQLWRAVNFNWPIQGYFHWSLVDNFEWERGWSQRFGLWGLDITTQVRTMRESARFYSEICKTNTISYDMVEKFAPEILTKIFPD